MTSYVIVLVCSVAENGMFGMFDAEEAPDIATAAAADDKTKTVSDVTKLICPPLYSFYFWRSCLQLMTSRSTAEYGKHVIYVMVYYIS